MPPELEQRRMLVIDDDVDMCAFIRAAVEHVGLDLDVDCAHDGYTGLLKVGLVRPHVLVLDIMLPISTALEIIPRLRDVEELPPDMRILVVTGSRNKTFVRRRLTQVQVDDVLFKPVTARELAAAVAHVLTKPAAKANRGQA